MPHGLVEQSCRLMAPILPLVTSTFPYRSGHNAELRTVYVLSVIIPQDTLNVDLPHSR